MNERQQWRARYIDPIKAVRLPRRILRSPLELLSRSAISIPQPHRDKDTLGPSGGTTSLNRQPNKDCPWLLLRQFPLETIDPWVINEKPGANGARKSRTSRCHPRCFELSIRTLQSHKSCDYYYPLQHLRLTTQPAVRIFIVALIQQIFSMSARSCLT